jgi:hypothetical protein
VTSDHDADVENLRLLESFFIPLTAEEAAERGRVFAESGTLDREMIIRALSGGPRLSCPG